MQTIITTLCDYLLHRTMHRQPPHQTLAPYYLLDGSLQSQKYCLNSLSTLGRVSNIQTIPAKKAGSCHLRQNY